MTIKLRIGGEWASTIASWGGLNWSTKTRGGVDEISWEMDVDTTFRHPLLKTDALVEICDGPKRIGAGVLAEPDLVSGSFSARGLYQLAGDFLCQDAALNPTSKADLAIDQAIARGLRWKRSQSINAGQYTGDEPTSGSNYLLDLLDAISDEFGMYWAIDSEGFVTMAAAETTPTWHLPPGLTDLGLAEEEYASDLFSKRLASGGAFATDTRGDAVARAAFGRREAAVDLTSLGVMSSGRAQTILDGMLAKGRARPAFTESVEVSSQQLLTAGGVPADLSMVQAGQVVRSHGFYDDIAYLSGRTYLDWLIGETKYEDGSDVITLSPQGLAPRDLAAVLAALPVRTSFRA